MSKKISNLVSFKKQCEGISLWQCPQFLFLIMGIIIIVTVVISYWLGARYVIDPFDPIGPYLVTLVVIALALVLFVLAFLITQSFERLAEASRLKSEFINIVSHQLRSPITNIKWATDFLISPDIETSLDKKNEYSRQLKENISLMVELVDDLLIISKIEEGIFPISKKEASLSNIVENLVNAAMPHANASGLELKFNNPASPLKASFDESMIKLVVENLIDNAIRYTKKDGKIEIWLKKEGKNLIFKIEDQGVGIPLRDQKYIYQKFFRSSNALKEQTKGSGLGLYIAKLIITKSSGKIWFESEEKKGTTFYFSIPIN